MTQAIAKRYSKALLNITEETGDSKNELKTLQLLSKTFDHEKSAEYLNNPVVSKEQKKEYFADILEKIGASPTIRNFINVVIEAGRISHLKEITRNFESILQEKSGIVPVTLTIPAKFSDAECNEIENKIKAIINKQVEFTREVDPSILGGFVAKFGNKVIDASLKTRLDALTKYVN